MKLPRMKVPGAKKKESREIQARYEKKVKEYADFLLDDGDFDWHSLVRMMHFKLVRMRDHMLEHKFFEGYEKVAAEIDEAASLLQRVMDDPYHDEVFADFYKKHGKSEMILGEPDEKGNVPADFIYANGKTATPAMHKEMRRLYKIEFKAKQKDIDKAFKMIGNKLMTWWC